MKKSTLVLDGDTAEDYRQVVKKRHIGLPAGDAAICIDSFGRIENYTKDAIYYVCAGAEQKVLEPGFLYSFDNYLFGQLEERAAKAKQLLGIKDSCASLMDVDLSNDKMQFICRTSLLINDQRYISAQKIVSMLKKITSDFSSIIMDTPSREQFIDYAKFFKERGVAIRTLYDNRDIFFSDYSFDSYARYTGSRNLEVNFYKNDNMPISANVHLDSSPVLSLLRLNGLGVLKLDYDYINRLKSQLEDNIISKNRTKTIQKNSLEYYSQLYKTAKLDSHKLFMIEPSMDFTNSLDILDKEGYLDNLPFICDFDRKFLADMYNKVNDK